MSNNIDDQVRDVLGDFKAEFDPGSWDMLSKRMSADPELGGDTEEVKEFDRTVKTKMNNIDPDYKSAHWKIMAERIQQEFSLRRRLIRYKVAEVGMVLLIIFTLINVVPGGKTNLKQKVRNLKEQIAKIRPNSSKDIKQFAENSTAAVPSANSNIVSIQPKEANDILKDIQNIENALAYAKNNTKLNENQPISAVPILKNKVGFHSETDKVITLSSVVEKEFAFADRQPILSSNEIEKETSKNGIARVGQRLKSFFKRNNAPVTSPEELTEAEISALEYETEGFTAGQSKVAEPIISTFGMRVSMFAGSDYNYIETPYDPIFDLDRNNRFVPGYQAGIALSFLSRKWEFETGGIYAKKEYDPGIPTEFIENLNGPPIKVAFDNIQLNMLEVPVNLRYHFGKSEKWRFYGQTGASLHMAMVANYDKFPSNLDALFAGAPQIQVPKLESKKFADGLLEGGNFGENSYYTFNLGMGAERLVSQRWSWFFQPSVKAYLLPTYNNGLGPNRDRISSISFLTGARVSLW